ncbi:phage tail tape measure protein [Lonepinella sp. BR2271]|uniref:phage tail tape measure protein n=1 Tax=Lonepinella sp. BR2271 TaxID=3434550 RepID=UPI003F6DEC77
MADNLDYTVSVRFDDQASDGVKKVTSEIEKGAKQATEAVKRGQQEQQNSAKKTDEVQRGLSEKAANYARRLSAVRSQLGVRSEHQIRREIQRTEAAYNRLARSGTASAGELRRAFAAQQQQVRALNAEMGRVSVGARVGSVFQGVAGLAAGVTAGAMVLREPVKKEMNYDRQLAMVANTAFSERDVPQRIAGKKELHEAVKKAVEVGGGSKEDALSSLDTMLASGVVKADTAMALLPTLQKGAVATGASSEDLAKIAISSMQQFGIGENDIGKVLDMAVAAGQAGNFELADMARWLPQQMAAAKSAGLSGIDGLQTLLVANQQARVTAGSSDEAGNNLVNLLAKITSKETTERFKKIEYTDKKGKKYDGINLMQSMENYKAKGQDSLQAFMSIMDDVIGNDKNYKTLQKKLKTAKTEERKALLEQMTNLVEGTAIGQVISDRQALMALLGIRNNVQLGEEVREQVEHSDGAVETSHQVIKDTNDYKTEDLKNTADFAQMASMKGFNNVLGNVSQQLADYGKEYPELASAIAGAGTGIKALGAAAMTAAGAVALLGGGRGLGGGMLRGGLGRVFTTAATAGTATATAGATTATAGTTASAVGAGLLAPVLVGAIGLGYSSNLNAGENDTVALQQKVASGTATPTELAQADSLYANNRAEVEQKRVKREAYFQQQGRPTLNAEQQAEYESALAPILAALAAKEKQANKKKSEDARSTLNNFWASDEEKTEARAWLDSQKKGKLGVSARGETGGYSGLANAELGKPSLLSGQSVGAIDFAPLQQSQQQGWEALRSGLSADIAGLGQKIESLFMGKETTIQNKITLEMDGRPVAEKTSEYQYREFKRGG